MEPMAACLRATRSTHLNVDTNTNGNVSPLKSTKQFPPILLFQIIYYIDHIIHLYLYLTCIYKYLINYELYLSNYIPDWYLY